MRCICLFLLADLALGALPVPAIDSLAVGLDGNRGRWNWIVEESRFLEVARDSIWTWPVAPGENLARSLGARGGRAVAAVEGEQRDISLLRVGTALHDGDPGTAYDPDDFPFIARHSPLIIDLGATFRIDRIRLFPRLDRDHIRRFLQQFRLSTRVGKEGEFEKVFSFSAANPNTEPVVERRFAPRAARFVQIEPTTGRAWEVAEVEVYGDGSTPVGTFLSTVLDARRQRIVWGRVRYEGGSIEGAPAVVQTRTGPDGEPVHYFRISPEIPDELQRVSRSDYEALPDEERGPIKPNPAWSAWQTVSGGLMRSPGLRRYMQFRLRMISPGAVIRRLVFEFARPPLFASMPAEISPGFAEPGAETHFTLSMEVRLRGDDSRDLGATGFRLLQVRTAARIVEVEKVLVDDEEIFFTAALKEGEGFDVNLWRRIEQSGTFLQIVFRGAIYRDHTRFEVRALDRRSGKDRRIETAYQVAEEREVDPELEGADLVVRFAGAGVPLLAPVQASAQVITPNGDGLNDRLVLRYALLKLVAPARVRWDIYSLEGRLLRRAYEGLDGSGSYEQVWDGRDQDGRLLAPGLYLYELRVEADEGSARRAGAIGVAY